MTELEKMQRAKMYIDKLANGINPLDNLPAADTDIINNVRLSRCLFYVSDILRQVIDNNGVVNRSKISRQPFFISAEKAAQFAISPTPISVSEITKRLNDLVDTEKFRKLSYTSITGWLIEIGALQTTSAKDGKNVKRPTEQGEELGISTEKRLGLYGEYSVVLYNEKAQEFILDNIEAIISYASSMKKATTASENQWRPWTSVQEECLIDLFNKDVPISEIAVTLKRSEGGVRARLKRLGLIDNIG